MDFPFSNQFLVQRIHRAEVVRPSRMVPLDDCTLGQGSFKGVHLAFYRELFRILDEEGVHVAEWFGPGDFRSVDDEDSVTARRRSCNPVGFVEVGIQVVPVRPVLDVVGDGDHIKSVVPCLLDSCRRPDRSVGEDCMNMQVRGQGDEAADVRNLELGSLVDVIVIFAFDEFRHLGADVPCHCQRHCHSR